MKLNCNVHVVNRSLTHHNISPRKKALRSCLAIGRASVKSDEIHLLLQNQQNLSGTKYKIDDNIERVFTRCVKEGKATIRLKNPAHDLTIKCDPLELKGFLHTLKLAISKSLDPSVLNISNLKPKTIAQSPKTKITVKTKSDYPILQGFPRTTEVLNIVDLGRKSFDRQILKLQSLRVLNLSQNHISSLPKELGTLAHLTELILSNNALRLGGTKWEWLNEESMARSLRLLDLSKNELTCLPPEIGKLKNLVTLNVNHNKIESLPQSIGVLPQLKYLDISQNCLKMLPGIMKSRKLEEARIGSNPYITSAPKVVKNYHGPKNLVEIAGRAVINHRLSYDASTIPFTLVHKLDKAHYCSCGKACLSQFHHCIQPLNVTTIANSVIFDGCPTVHFQFICCSSDCLWDITRKIQDCI